MQFKNTHRGIKTLIILTAVTICSLVTITAVADSSAGLTFESLHLPFENNEWSEKESVGKIYYKNVNGNTIVLDPSDFDKLATRIESCNIQFENLEKGVGLITPRKIDDIYAGEISLNPNGTIKSSTYLPNKIGQPCVGLLANSIDVDCSGSNVTPNNLPVDVTTYDSEGNLIVGNGADINNAYNQGFVDGQNSIYGNLSITYTYHHHTGNSSSGGGCYRQEQYATGSHEESDGQECWTCSGFIGPDGDWWACCNAKSSCSGHCREKKRTVIDYAYRWVLGCGRTEGEITSATIVY